MQMYIDQVCMDVFDFLVFCIQLLPHRAGSGVGIQDSRVGIQDSISTNR